MGALFFSQICGEISHALELFGSRYFYVSAYFLKYLMVKSKAKRNHVESHVEPGARTCDVFSDTKSTSK